MAVSVPITGINMDSSTLTPSDSSRNRGSILVKPSYFRPNFFGHGVGTPKYTGIQLSHSSRHICNLYGRGSLGAQMNLFDWFTKVIKSYANALISTDPEKVLDQTITEMNNDLGKINLASLKALTSQLQLENKYKAAQQAFEDWNRNAQLALGKGEEDLAREALIHRDTYADKANALKNQLDQQKIVVDNLESDLRLLKSKIQKARAREEYGERAELFELLGFPQSETTSGIYVMENLLTSDEFEEKLALPKSSSVDDEPASYL